MDFTVVGDVVNVAARLQELAKEVEADTLISEATFRALEGRFHAVPEPAVVLRGRKEPTVTYRLTALSPENAEIHGLREKKAFVKNLIDKP